MTLAMILLGVGLVFIMAEVLIPSLGLLGGLATIALIGSVVVAWQESPELGQNFLLAEAVLVPAAIMTGLKLLPKSPFTKFLVAPGFSFKDAAAVDERDQSLLGKRGVVEAQLRPAGIARIDGRRVDVVTRGEMLAVGIHVEVCGLSGNRVEVRACEEQDSTEINETDTTAHSES